MYLSFIQHKHLEIVCNLGSALFFFNHFNTRNRAKNPKIKLRWIGNKPIGDMFWGSGLTGPPFPPPREGKSEKPSLVPSES